MELLARNWWALALRGVLAILFGLGCFLVPETALVALMLLFAAYLMVDGGFAVVAGIRAAGRHQRWGMLAAEGVLGLCAGAMIASFPGITLIYLIYVAGFWAILSGAALLAAAIRLYRLEGEWLMLAAGLLSLLWGMAVLVWPAAGVVVWAWWIGFYALLFGIVMLALGLRLRRGLE